MKPISFPWQQGRGQNGGLHEDYTMPLTKNQTVAIAFSCKDSGADASDDLAPTLRSMNETNGNANAGGQVAVATPMSVRRLTPVECARLQGFPDDYLDISYRNKPAADGPKYKALGNSMAVPVMSWIGARIALVEDVLEAAEVEY